jgi:hypothetical protein
MRKIAKLFVCDVHVDAPGMDFAGSTSEIE